MSNAAAEISLPLKGGCQCGHIRYAINAEPATLYLCHCKDCQKQSSSAFGMSLWAERDAFIVVSGQLTFWETRGESGAIKQCSFCNQCGSRIYHCIDPEASEYVSVKAGTLDDCASLKPIAQIWTQSALSWNHVLESGLPSFSKESDDETLMRLWRDRKA